MISRLIKVRGAQHSMQGPDWVMSEMLTAYLWFSACFSLQLTVDGFANDKMAAEVKVRNVNCGGNGFNL